WALAIAIGLSLLAARLNHKAGISGVVILFAISAWYCISYGGDTPERLRAFGRRQHVTLPLAFDQGKKAHAAFGLSGFPGIVVIDRAGRVRLTRQGYNSSEASFRGD